MTRYPIQYWNGYLLSFQPLARIDEFTCVCLEQEGKQEDKHSATKIVRLGHNPVRMETSIAADLKNLPKGRLQRKFPTQKFNTKVQRNMHSTQKSNANIHSTQTLNRCCAHSSSILRIQRKSADSTQNLIQRIFLH